MRENCPYCGRELDEPEDDSINGTIRFLIRDRDGNLVDIRRN